MPSFRFQIISLADEYERITDECGRALEDVLLLQKENSLLKQQLRSCKADQQVGLERPESPTRLDLDNTSKLDVDELPSLPRDAKVGAFDLPPALPRSPKFEPKDEVDIDGLDIRLEHENCAVAFGPGSHGPSKCKAPHIETAFPEDPFPLDVATERQTLAPVWTDVLQNGQNNGKAGNESDAAPVLVRQSTVKSDATYSDIELAERESSKESARPPVQFTYSTNSAGQGLIVSSPKSATVLSRWFDPGVADPGAVDPAQPVDASTPDFRTTFSQLASKASIAHKDALVHDCCVLHPFGRLRLSWDMMAFACLMIDLWLTPMDLIFLNSCPMPQVLETLGHSITIFFTADILLNFSTGFLLGDQIIMRRPLVIMNYLKFWFWVDLVATIPFHLMTGTETGEVLNTARAGKASRALKALRYLKMVRAARLVKSLSTAARVFQHSKFLGPVRAIFKGLQVLVFLVIFAHVHGCIWAAMQPEWMDVLSFSEAMRRYFRSFWWAYIGVTVGAFESAEVEGTPFIWLLEMVIASERISLIVYAAMNIMFHSLSFMEEAQQEHRGNAILTYLRQRAVSIETQIQVSFFLSGIKKARKLQTHYEAVLSNDLPMELKMSIQNELWMERLSSLGLIAHVSTWHPAFLLSLTNIVREDVYPPRALLCKAGDHAMAAFYIIQGELLAIRVENKVTLPKFTRGMWVGENALASAALRCFATVQTRILTCCMVLSGESFQQLLSELGLMREFQDFCSEQLWKGLCGRCGLLGDHFSDTCPGPLARLRIMNGRLSSELPMMSPTSSKDKDETSSVFGMAEKCSTASDSGMSYSTANSTVSFKLQSSGSEDTTKRSLLRSFIPSMAPKPEVDPDSPRSLGRDLVHFLTEHKLMRLYHILQQLQIHHLDGLECVDVGIIKGMLSTGDELTPQEEEALSETTIKSFKAKCKNEVNQALFRKVSRLHHYIFLSHYKVEAGTEAALMRTDIEQVLAEELDGPGHWFDEPVFLDSENLTNLKDLQSRVSHTHNLVLLLTKEVLARPWVLVEILTARKHGVFILPVRVEKPGEVFVYPDDAFFGSLRNGKFLDRDATDLLIRCGFTLAETEKALRAVFQQIAVNYSPHKTSSIRRAEIGTLLKQCHLKQISKDLRRSRGEASGTQRSSSSKRTMGHERRPSTDSRRV